MAGEIQNVNSLGNISQILALINGTQTSQTTSSNISSEGMQALMNQLMAGTQGLSAISGATKASGGYNSTAQSLLTNDLITRASGQLAAQQAGTTTTTKTPAKVTGSNLLGLAGTLGGNALLGPTIKGLAKKTGVNTWGDDIANALGLGSNTVAASMPSAVSAASAGSNYASLVNQIGDGSGFLENLAGSLFTDSVGEAAAATAGSSLFSSVAGVGEAGWGMDLGLDAIGSTVAADSALSFVPYIGPALIANQILGNPAQDIISGIGDVFSSIGDIFGW